MHITLRDAFDNSVSDPCSTRVSILVESGVLTNPPAELEVTQVPNFAGAMQFDFPNLAGVAQIRFQVDILCVGSTACLSPLLTLDCDPDVPSPLFSTCDFPTNPTCGTPSTASLSLRSTFDQPIANCSTTARLTALVGDFVPGQITEVTSLTDAAGLSLHQFPQGIEGDGFLLFRVDFLAACSADSLPVCSLFRTVDCPPAGRTLTRAEAVAAILDPIDGLGLNDSLRTVWCPFVDYGFGATREGLLPAGSSVVPAHTGTPPILGSPISLSSDSYFFWVDDEPGALFLHPTRFVTVDATNASPTVANGGIVASDQGWWPIVTPLGGAASPHWESHEQRLSDFPASPTNPTGLVSGTVPSSSDTSSTATPPATPKAGAKCGLLIQGETGVVFNNTMDVYASDLNTHFGVDSSRIVRAPPGSTSVKTAITNVCNLNPAPSEIYVRITSHGFRGGLTFGQPPNRESVSAAWLCNQFRRLAAKSVPVHVVIEACYSGSLFDFYNWDLPPGSSIITSTDSDNTCWGGTFRPEGGGTQFTEGLYSHALSVCLKDPAADFNGDLHVNEQEAASWIVTQNPCYELPILFGLFNFYPKDSNPQKRIVPRYPRKLAINVCNSTGSPQTHFEWVFKGNVIDFFPTPRARRSNAQGVPQSTWTSSFSLTYNAITDETTLRWSAAGNPVQPGDYVLFSYESPNQMGLRALRHAWDSASSTMWTALAAPTKEQSIFMNENVDSLYFRVNTRSLGSGGFGADVLSSLSYRILSTQCFLDDFHLGNPTILTLPEVPLGSFTLQPDSTVEFGLAIPGDLTLDDILLIESTDTWTVNGNATTELVALVPQGIGQSVGVVDFAELPMRLLSFPNPSKGHTVLRYNTPLPRDVSVDVYDIQGRLVRHLLREEDVQGQQEVSWDGFDSNGHRSPSGVYFFRVAAGTERHTWKQILLRE